MPGGWIGEARATGGAAETSTAEPLGTEGAAISALPAAGDAASALAAADLAGAFAATSAALAFAFTLTLPFFYQHIHALPADP